MFGKLVITWRRNTYVTNLDGFRRTYRYEVIATDSSSVVIRYYDEFSPQGSLRQINFSGDYYCMAASGGSLCEYFRRIPNEE